MGKNAEEIPEVIDNLRRVFQAINEYSRTAERTTGLTGTQLWSMKLLAKTAPIRVSDLARKMYLRPATVVGILDRLESKGIVTRNRSTEDRRAVDLRLTEKGEELAATAPEVVQAMLAKGLNELSDEQFLFVAEGMKQVVRILGAEDIIPQPLHS